MAPVRALVVCYGGGHVNIALHLLRASALSDSPLAITVLALSTAAPKLRAHGFEPLSVTDIVDPNTDAAALREGERLAATMHTEGLGISRRESVAYLGLSMAEFRDRCGADSDALLERFGRAVWCPLEATGRVLDRVRPDVVVATNSPRAERAALLAAEARGVPTLRIEDLFGRTAIIRPIVEGLGRDAARRVVGEMTPTASAVMNDLAAEVYGAHAAEELVRVTPGRVVVTGQPVLERAVERGSRVTAHEATALRARYGLPMAGTVLLWATDNLVPDRAIMTALAEWVAERPDVHLCVKLHPGPSSEVRAFFQGFSGSQITIREEGDIHDLVLASDATFSHFSTVGLEVALLQRPLLLFDLEGGERLPRPYQGLEHFYDGTIPMFRHAATRVLTSLDRLGPALVDLVPPIVAAPLPESLRLPSDGAIRLLDLVRDLGTGVGVGGGT